jgi:multiple sugar transport system permease protein
MSTTDTRLVDDASATSTDKRRRTAKVKETKPKTTAGFKARRGLLYVTLSALLLVFIAPLVWAISGSFKNRGDIFSTPPTLIPNPATTENYTNLLTTQPFWSWFGMSLAVAIIATVISVFVCALAGYGFAKFNFRGKKILFSIMFSSLSVPFAVILVPLFILVVKTGLSTPLFSLVVPWVAPAFGIFMMQQYIVQSIPDEIIEAARIDGNSEFGTFWRVVLPLLRPSLGALGVWSFLQTYNSFLWPLVLVSDSNLYTLPLGLNILFSAENRSFDLVLAGAVLASVPTILVFFLLRKQLLDGLAAGAVKG